MKRIVSRIVLVAFLFYILNVMGISPMHTVYGMENELQYVQDDFSNGLSRWNVKWNSMQVVDGKMVSKYPTATCEAEFADQSGYSGWNEYTIVTRVKRTEESANSFFGITLRQASGSYAAMLLFRPNGIRYLKKGDSSEKSLRSYDFSLNTEYEYKIAVKGETVNIYFKGPGDNDYNYGGGFTGLSTEPGTMAVRTYNQKAEIDIVTVYHGILEGGNQQQNVYFDDFSQGASQWGIKWSSMEVANGKLVNKSKDSMGEAEFYSNGAYTQFEDFTASMKFKRTDEKSGSYFGILVRQFSGLPSTIILFRPNGIFYKIGSEAEKRLRYHEIRSHVEYDVKIEVKGSEIHVYLKESSQNGFSFGDIIYNVPVQKGTLSLRSYNQITEMDDVKIESGIFEQNSVAASVYVEESQKIKTANRRYFGSNNEWGSIRNALENPGEPVDLSTPQDYLNLMQGAGIPMPLNRMAGFSSQIFNWKPAVGPWEERQEQPYGNGMLKFKVGPVEWIKATLQVDPEAEFVWVLNLAEETPQDHADLAEFLTGDGIHDPNGGINWAQKRIDAGLQEPVKIAVWELGNELDWAEHREQFPIAKYVQDSKNAIQAIKAVQPDAKFSAHAATNPWDVKAIPNWRSWHIALFEDSYLRENLNYISFHTYYYGKPVSELMQYIQMILDDRNRITGSDFTKIYISEHAVWPEWYTDQNGNTVYMAEQTHSLKGVLSTAEFLTRILNHKDIYAATYHAFTSGPWGWMYKSKETGQKYLSGIADLMKLYAENTEGDILQTTVTGDYTGKTDTYATFMGTVYSTPEGMNIVLVNRDPLLKREVSFSFSEGKYRLKQESILTADSMNSYNTVTEKAIHVEKREVGEPAEFCSYQVPEKSMVVLQLERKIDRTALGESISTAENALKSAEEGFEVGQYPRGMKEKLLSAITSAQAVYESVYASQKIIDAANADLNTMLSYFKGRMITQATGDLTGDGTVTVEDFKIVARNLHAVKDSPEWDCVKNADINDNGVIDNYDHEFIRTRMILNNRKK